MTEKSITVEERIKHLQNRNNAVYTGLNKPGQLSSSEEPPNPFMDRRQSDKILLAHVRASFASFDNEAKQRYIYSLLHEQNELTTQDIEKMLGLSSDELYKLQRELD